MLGLAKVRLKIAIILLVAVFVSTSCAQNPVEVSPPRGTTIITNDYASLPYRDYYLGFTPFPYDITPIALNDTYAKIGSHGDIIAHHLDAGVPWPEALSNLPFHPHVIDDWATRKSKTPAGFKVVVSVSPLNAGRSALALYQSSSDNMPLPGAWSTYNLNHPNVKTAFLNYCNRAIQQFHPDYFVYAIEINLLMKQNKANWSAFVEFSQYVYTSLKAAHPSLPVFVSYTGFDLKGYTDAPLADQQQAFSDTIPYSDYFGLSLHPQLSSFLCEGVPDELVLEGIYSLSTKPIAICETSYPGQYLTIGGGSIVYNGSKDKQDLFFRRLFSSCDKHNTEFIINFVPQDYYQLWVAIGSPDDINKVWRDTGFYDANGVARTVLLTWTNRLSCAHR